MKKLILMLLAANCFGVVLHAQVTPQKTESTMKDVVTRLQSLSTDRIIEKAYLHFDKPYYNPGDTIYFKAYVTAGERHELSKISGVLHVDLVSTKDSVMQSIILQLKNGLAWGDFALPAYLAKGNYRVRAYTQWMQNAGNAYFFNRMIAVNGKGAAASLPASAGNKTDVQFFPEGGTFVANVPSRLAFKAVGSNGLGLNIAGTIVDNNNVEVARFTSAHLGMGQVFLTPEEGKTYKAKITYPDKSVNTVDLPAPESKGISLTVKNNDLTKLSIDVNANKPYYLANKDKEIYVIIYSAGVVKTVKTVLDNQVIGFDLPKKDLKTGITQITLFAENGTPLSERLVFIQNADEVNFNVSSDKTAYASHERAHIVLNARTADDKAVVGNFSVAVIDDSKVHANEDAENSILSDMLLTSELRGYVEQPGYYFNNVNTDTRSNLDILMLTQGYRRFAWKSLLTETPGPMAYQPEVGMQIKGTLVTTAGKPVPNEKISLMLSATGQTMSATTDAAGKFAFSDLAYADRTRFLLTVESKSIQKKTRMVLDKVYTGVPLNAVDMPDGNADQKMPEYTNMSNGGEAGPAKAKELKPVTVKDKANYATSSLAGAGNADQVIFKKDFQNASTLSQGLTGIARNIDFNQGRAFIRGGSVVAMGNSVAEPMMVVVDGGIIQSGVIDNYSPTDVESVEILKGANASIYGLGAGAGVLIINTRKGDSNTNNVVSKETAPGILSIAPQGFYKAREFYTPVYEATKKWPAEDRATIYWKPNLETSATGNAAFEYFNDGPGRYRVVIEGIDNAGNIGRAVYKYTVQ